MNIDSFFSNIKNSLNPDLQFWSDFSAISLIAADVFWIALLYQALALPPGGWQPSVLVLVLGLFGSNFINRTLLRSKSTKFKQTAILGVFSLFLILLSYEWLYYTNTTFSLTSFFLQPVWSLFFHSDSSKEFWHLVFILGVIWRGIALSSDSHSSESPLISFVVGIILFLIYGIFFQWQYSGISFTCFFAFIFFSLVSLGTGKIAAIGSDRMGKVPAYHPLWLFWILGISFLLVGFSLLAGWIFSSPLSAFINQILILLYLIFIGFIILILYPVTWIMGLAFPYLQNLFNNLSEEDNSGQTIQDYMNQLINGQEENSTWIIQAFQSLRPWFLVTIILLMIIVIVFVISSRSLYTRKLLGMEDGEPAQPLLPFQNRIAWLTGKVKKNKQVDWMTAARIRRVYRQLLELAYRLGEPRFKSLTPLEYLPELVRLFPKEDQGLSQITDWYNAIRYGEIPETTVEVEQAEEMWLRIEVHGKTMLQEQNRARKNPIIR